MFLRLLSIIFWGVCAAEVRRWERQLERIQEVLNEWTRIQRGWLALEAIFSTEDIVVQMPREANMFKEVDSAWRRSVDLVSANPNVLAITETPGLLDLLKERNRTLDTIYEGLEGYVRKRRLSFTR